MRCGVGIGLAAALGLAASRASGQGAPPAPHQDVAFDFMNLLTQHEMHDLKDESWNAYGQFTYIFQYKPGFSAPYTNANGSINSLVPDPEVGYTGSFTLFFGARLWPGAQAYFVPEVIAEKAFSQLRGIGASIQDFELQKTGSIVPSLYRSRTFLRQNIDIGGSKVEQDSNPMQLGTTVDSRRVVLTAGTFTILDVFDHNNVTGDPRQTFLNMAFMTHSSWDFAADARGFSLGAAAELYWDDWALRIARMAPPLNPNQLPIDVNLAQVYADALELEHDHVLFGQAGAVRLLGYRNHEVMGQFADAIKAFETNPAMNAADCPSNVFSYGSGNLTAPDLCWVRKPNTKWGVGINLEQYVGPDVGVFLRAMYSDGHSEVDAFDPADRDLSFGAVAKGQLWHRPFDVTGVGYAFGWISSLHAKYLEMGGVDGFVGDGDLSPAPEMTADVFYSFNLLRAIWLTGDYQLIFNPGFNSARGPVNVMGGRVHVEF
ncbi:MAG TPA: carbohydrate porin [Polyangiaceae bacterium]|nr:carbohydrate porin [Polyangiaceae bacterium]